MSDEPRLKKIQARIAELDRRARLPFFNEDGSKNPVAITGPETLEVRFLLDQIAAQDAVIQRLTTTAERLREDNDTLRRGYTNDANEALERERVLNAKVQRLTAERDELQEQVKHWKAHSLERSASYQQVIKGFRANDQARETALRALVTQWRELWTGFSDDDTNQCADELAALLEGPA